MATRRREVDARLDTMRDGWGNLERRYATDVLLVPPDITVEGDRLVWRLRPRRDREKASDLALRHRSGADAARNQWNARRILPGAHMLRAFAKLADAPPQILAFAKRWGPLGLCQHGLPSCHGPLPQVVVPHRMRGLPVIASFNSCAPCGWDGESGWEPLSKWTSYAQRARALLFLAAPGTKATREDIQPLARDLGLTLLGRGALEKRKRKIYKADWWNMVIGVVNQWIADGGVRPRLLLTGDIHQSRPRLVLTPPWRTSVPEFALFGALGMQLAFAVSSERGLAYCSSCGTWFEPGRQLRAGERHYCDACRTSGAPQRAATADYRARQRAGTTKPRRGRSR